MIFGDYYRFFRFELGDFFEGFIGLANRKYRGAGWMPCLTSTDNEILGERWMDRWKRGKEEEKKREKEEEKRKRRREGRREKEEKEKRVSRAKFDCTDILLLAC